MARYLLKRADECDPAVRARLAEWLVASFFWAIRMERFRGWNDGLPTYKWGIMLGVEAVATGGGDFFQGGFRGERV